MTAVAAGGAPAAGAARRYPCLDGLRAIAATVVVLTHAAFMTGNYAETGAGRFFARLDVGVALFFALSGFLLALPMLRAVANGEPRPRTAAYLWRRALRVLPVYWLTVVVALLLFPGENGASPGDWLRHVALAQIYGWGWLREGLTHTWSLSTEVSFYLVLPFLVAGLARLSGDRWRPRRVLAGLGALMLLGLVWLYWAEADERVTGPLNLWLPAFACWFGVGVGMAVLVATGPSWRPVRVAHELGRSPWTCWAIAGALFWITCTPVAGAIGLVQQSGAEAVTRNLLYAGVAAFVVWPLVFGPQREGRLRVALSSRPMAYLGEISYGIFLFHLVVLHSYYIVIDQPTFTGDVWSTAVVGWAGGALIAAASYRLMERPLMTRWRGLVPDRRRAPAGTGSSAAPTAPTATAPST
ncbi:acyltransferase family protein [Pseudonocardia lacus]|uniref:acyltransferase family protein n=1 Tax=Pseudonocardia lacus TaxID=2835865 RepID=UPI001BDD8396|nr:acyltransferase [Pseudonocardia lacus]